MFAPSKPRPLSDKLFECNLTASFVQESFPREGNGPLLVTVVLWRLVQVALCASTDNARRRYLFCAVTKYHIKCGQSDQDVTSPTSQKKAVRHRTGGEYGATNDHSVPSPSSPDMVIVTHTSMPFVTETKHRMHLLGQLTETGRRRIQKLGREIRIRYADVLQGSNDAAVIRALSSPVQRCRDSVKLLLTGLSPNSKINDTVADMLSEFGNKFPAVWSSIDRISNSESNSRQNLARSSIL